MRDLHSGLQQQQTLRGFLEIDPVTIAFMDYHLVIFLRLIAELGKLETCLAMDRAMAIQAIATHHREDGNYIAFEIECWPAGTLLHHHLRNSLLTPQRCGQDGGAGFDRVDETFL